MPPLTFFRAGRSRQELEPLRDAASTWIPGTSMRGMAVSAALAREAERHLSSEAGDGWTPGRWTVDFARPALLELSTLQARTLRRGRRLVLVEVEMRQGREGRVVAWGRGAFLRAGEAASGRVWQPDDVGAVLPPDRAPGEPRMYWTESVGWTADPDEHGNVERKAIWQRPFIVVEGEPPTPFAFVAGAADVASVATQWGDQGVRHINVDLSLHLVRLPESVGDGIGIASVHRIAQGGQSIGTAAIRDSAGTFGTATVTAVQNEVRIPADQLRSSHGSTEPVAVERP
ncbi:thioesterase family protein [Cnuibacter physcomitrellae]|uniref:thioesterase family protein n=1 Tax=Cnuibacter physcomitrellae TaxID=1619308 RepID=UPI002175F41D|nr:thioesterase family protein [Cnuibacter physcomitrellae]MCS5498252.1 thioesterase family protein [Cnuibacter physcomitrellae]